MRSYNEIFSNSLLAAFILFTIVLSLHFFLVFLSFYGSIRINNEDFIVGQTIEVIDEIIDYFLQ